MKYQCKFLPSLLLITVTLLFSACNGCGQQTGHPVVPPEITEHYTLNFYQVVPRTYISNSVSLTISCFAGDDYSHPLPQPRLQRKLDVMPIWSENPSFISKLYPIPSSEAQTLPESDLQTLWHPNPEYIPVNLGNVIHVDCFFLGCHLSYLTTVHKTETYYRGFFDPIHPKYNGSCQCYGPLTLSKYNLAGALRYPIPSL